MEVGFLSCFFNNNFITLNILLILLNVWTFNIQFKWFALKIIELKSVA